MSRTAHYVVSTHWDREWYEPFQGYRLRLVSLLDECFDVLQRDPQFKTFVMDGQSIPATDYLEIRPDRADLIRQFVAQSRLKLGPWYVLPDEWLVSGESLVRNLQFGMNLAREFGATSRAGFACDMFGHTSQLPQIFSQFDITAAFIWRGTHEADIGAQFRWIAPDGTPLPAYRFGKSGYCTYYGQVRKPAMEAGPFNADVAVEKMVEYVLAEAKRAESGPILIFDGGDHIEIEPQTSGVIARASEQLASHGIRLIHSDLDAYARELAQHAQKIEKSLVGELRESARDPGTIDEQWLIPGVLSSRINLKQANAACEDELCLWAEPFSAFATAATKAEWPAGYLRTAWRHLLENHPHDSICGCSIDPVHKDMEYRFDQSLGISSRLTNQSLRSIATASAPRERVEKSVVLTIFNPTADAIDEAVDIDVPVPTDWPNKFQEFFGYEEKFAFVLKDDQGKQIPWQLVGQRREQPGFRRPRYHFPAGDRRHVVSITAAVRVPAFGYTTLVVEPAPGPTRHLGTMSLSHRAIENEHLRVEVNANGTIDLFDKRTGKTFRQLLTFDNCADIGDGWFHGLAVNDQVFTSAASGADVALIADGINKATLRISLTMNVPEEFDFRLMCRSEHTAPLKIVSDVTLRRGADRVEVATTVQNTIRDHRLRVLFPTDLAGDTYLADAAFDVVERPVALVSDNNTRRELDVEGRPQQTFTAFGDGKVGLAVVTRGQPESAVRDIPSRPIALTLLRAFRRAVMSGDNPGGQVQGPRTFRYSIVPFAGQAPVRKLLLLGQRILSPTRITSLVDADLKDTTPATLPSTHSFLSVEGNVVVTSIQRHEAGLLVRFFNPTTAIAEARCTIPGGMASATAINFDSKPRPDLAVRVENKTARLAVPPKRIVSLLLVRENVR